MEQTKRFYWLKLKKDFLKEKAMMKLKCKYPEKGKIYTYIYLELLLETLDIEGKYYFEGVEDTIEEEIALEFIEDPEDVAFTLNYLEQVNLLVRNENYIQLVKIKEMTGSETADAERMRRNRKPHPNSVIAAEQCSNRLEQCSNDPNNVRQRKRKRKSKSKNNITDDDRTGENPRAGNNVFWIPNDDSEYQCLCDELILSDPHMRPDVEIRVDEERNLIEEMFSSYDHQKVIRAMKKARDNGAKSFTYARKILLEQGQSAYTSPKANKQDLVIPKTNWKDFVECVKSGAMREMLEQTPEEYRELILQKTVFYSASEITKTLRIAHIEFDDCFEGVEKVYAYFSYLLKWKNYFFRLAREQQPFSTSEEQEVYSLAKIDQMWGYGSGLLEGY